MIRSAVIAVMASAMAAVSAAGEPANVTPEAALGSWTLTSERHLHDTDTCQITGALDVFRGENGAVTCRLETVHACDTLPTSSAVQTCAVAADGDGLRITSMVETYDTWASTYCPDNFTVRLDGPGVMRGVLQSCGPAPDVVFTRKEAAIS